MVFEDYKMIDLIKKLHDLAELIGNGVSVGIRYVQSDNHPPVVEFLFDWPNNFHSRIQYSYLRLESGRADLFPEIIERLAAMAKEEYAKNN